MKLPITQDGTTYWRDRVDYIPQKWAILDKSYPEAFITTTRLKATLEMLEAGMMNPSDMEEWMGEVADDIQLAKDHESLVNEKTETEAQSLELAIVEAANTGDLATGITEVLKHFDMGVSMNQCKPKEGTTDIQIGRGVEVMAGLKNWSSLGLADLLNALEDRGHEDAVNQIITQLGLEDDYVNLHKHRLTARVVSDDLRSLPGLKLSHLCEVATSRFSKDPEEQKTAIKEVLTEASEKGYNVLQTREACLNRKGKTTKPTPLPAKTFPRYLIYVPNCQSPCCASYTNVEPHTEPGQVVFDLQEGLVSFTETKAHYHVWQPVPTNCPPPIPQIIEVEDEVALVIEK